MSKIKSVLHQRSFRRACQERLRGARPARVGRRQMAVRTRHVVTLLIVALVAGGCVFPEDHPLHRAGRNRTIDAAVPIPTQNSMSNKGEEASSEPADVGDAEPLPIFDTHVHYSRDAWSVFSPRQIVDKLDASNVWRALVSSSPDEGTRMLYAVAPERIAPFLRPYHDAATSGNWYRAPKIVDYLLDRLGNHPYDGIGEFHLHAPVNVELPSVRQTLAEAVARDIYLHIHADADTVAAVFAVEPRAKVLWAHAGMTEPPQEVSAMMDSHANLWTDLSYREYEIAPEGELAPAWRALFLRHPERITVGSDTWVTLRWKGYDHIIAQHRVYLEQLPREVAEQLAYRNAARLFGAGQFEQILHAESP